MEKYYKTFKGKTVLLIAPKYYGYERIIENKLSEFGAKVHFICENIDHVNLWMGFFLRRFPNKKQAILDYYYLHELKKLKDKIDYLIVIRGSTLSKSIISSELRKKNEGVKSFLYQWDSVTNNKNALEIETLFDKVSTFDPIDAQTYGWEYRPLFYSFSSTRDEKRKYLYSYICIMHSQRIKIFNKLKTRSDKVFLYLYCEKNHYYKQKYLKKNKEYLGADDKDVKHHPLSLEQTNEVMSNSNAIIDYTHPLQTGFTMRTIESIGHKCKLITNNKRALESDFYRPENVYVYDENAFSIPQEFLETPYVELSDEIYKKYGIDNWLFDVMGM